MTDADDWTVVYSKKKRSSSKRSERKEREAMKQSWSELRESTEEMNVDLIPYDRMDLSARPSGTKLGFHVASTSNTLRTPDHSSDIGKEPSRIERIALEAGPFDSDGTGMRSAIVSVGKEPSKAEYWYRNPNQMEADYSLNKQKRWELVNENDEEFRDLVVEQRYECIGVGYKFEQPTFAKVVENAPHAVVAPPRLVQTRKGTKVQRRRLPGKHVHSRERNRQVHPQWAHGEIAAEEEVPKPAELVYDAKNGVYRSLYTSYFVDGKHSRQKPSTSAVDVPEHDLYRLVKPPNARHVRRIPRGKREERRWKYDYDYSSGRRKMKEEEKNWRSQLI